MVKAYFINPFNDQFQNMLPAVLNIITPIPNISGWRISFESRFWSTSFRPQPITSIHKHPGLSLEKSSHFFTLSFIKSHKKNIKKKSLQQFWICCHCHSDKISLTFTPFYKHVVRRQKRTRFPLWRTFRHTPFQIWKQDEKILVRHWS